MDETTKFRLLGAIFWLGLLVFIVPSWYSQPVNFQPQGHAELAVTTSLPKVEKPFLLPDMATPPLATPPQSIQAKDGNVANTVKVEQASPQQPSAVTKPSVANPEVNQKPLSLAEIKARLQKQDKVTGNNLYINWWLVKVIAYKDYAKAIALKQELLAQDYPAYIRFFEKSKVFSVRVGPIKSQSKARKLGQELDKMFRVESIVVEIS